MQLVLDIDTGEEREVDADEWRRLMGSQTERWVTIDPKTGHMIALLGRHHVTSRAAAAVEAWRRRREEGQRNG